MVCNQAVARSVDSDGSPSVKPDRAQLKILHETIRKVTDDIEGHRFNTAISALMIFTNEAMKWEERPIEVLKPFLLILSPFAPHLAEEMWERLGDLAGETAAAAGRVAGGSTGASNGPVRTLAYEPWPAYEEALLEDDSKTYAVQVNGKVRGQIEVPADRATDKEFVLDAARNEPAVSRHLDKGQVVKEIFVPNRVINFVVR
jgi:leucyl-tRNA synthetase